MADSVQSFNRNRTIFIFAVGLIVLVLIFLGGLWFSNQRGNQLGKLATTDGLKTEDIKKPQEKKAEPKKEEPKKKPEEQKKSNPSQTPPEKKKETPKAEPKPKPQPKKEAPTHVPPAVSSVPRTGPSDSIPATGSEGWLLAIPVLLIVGYVFFEFRRSRQAIQRAAYHENSGILTLDS